MRHQRRQEADVVRDAADVKGVERLPHVLDRLVAGAAMYVYGYRTGLVAAGAGALYIADSFGWMARAASTASRAVIT